MIVIYWAVAVGGRPSEMPVEGVRIGSGLTPNPKP